MFKQLPRLNEMWEGGDMGMYVPRKQEVAPWKAWFAWRPVKLHGKRVWLKKIYRRCINTYVDHDDWRCYEYGTAFDVIRGDEFTDNMPVQPPPRKVK